MVTHYCLKLRSAASEEVSFDSYRVDPDTGFLAVKERDQPLAVVILNRAEARELAAVLNRWADEVLT